MSPVVVEDGGGGGGSMATSGFRMAVRELAPDGTQIFPSDRWTVSTGTAMPGFPASKLLTDLLSDYWSAWSSRASASWISVVSSSAGILARSIGLIGILGVNRRTPTAFLPRIGEVRGDGSTITVGTLYTPNTVRFRIDSHPLSDRIRPTFTVTSKTNLTGSNSNLTGHPIDPPFDPAPVGYFETKLSPTNSALATSVVLTFANHYSTESPLAGTETFRVHVRNVNSPLLVPSLTTVIYQSGSPVLTLSFPTYEHVEAESSSGGFIVTYTFAAASLASQTAAIEMHVSASTACDFIGAELVLSISTIYDSGVKTFSDIDLSAVVERLDFTNAGITYFHIEPGDFCSYIAATYSKVGGGTASVNVYSPIVAPGDADGRLHVGRLVISDALIFPISNSGYQIQRQSTGGGQRTSTRAGSFRAPRVSIEWNDIDLSIVHLSQTLHQKLSRLLRVLGLSRTPTLLVPDPAMTEDSIVEQTMPRWVVVTSKSEAHQGRLTGIDTDSLSDGNVHTRDHWDLNVRFSEHSGVQAGY